MKDSNFVFKAFAVVGFLAVMAYFAVSIAGYLVDPLTSTTAYYYSSDDALTVSGYLIRDEEVLEDADGLLYITRGEGEKVAKGKRVAVLYHSSETLAQAQRLEELRVQLEQLEYAQSVASGGQAVLKLDESIMEGLFTMKGHLSAGDLNAAGQESDTLRTLVLRRDYAFRGEDDVESQIAALQEEIRSLENAAGKGSTGVTAPSSGYFSSLVDGYETVLTPESMEKLTPSVLKNTTPDHGVTSQVGKIIHSSTWYYAAVVDADAPLIEGDSVTLRFASGLDKDIPMTVYSLGKEDRGERVLVLETDRYGGVTTLLRHQNAQIIFDSYAGIRVPKDALRVVTETIEDGSGGEITQRMTGVYCRIGLAAQFKPVSVVYQGEDYYLVEADPTILGQMTEKQLQIRTLRSGDDVIVTAHDLYDGKVIGA